MQYISISFLIHFDFFLPLFITISILLFTFVLSYTNLAPQLQPTLSILKYLDRVYYYILVSDHTNSTFVWSGSYLPAST